MTDAAPEHELDAEEVAPDRPPSLIREEFLVAEADVTGIEELRDEKDRVTRPASVQLTFIQKANIPGLHPHPAGNGQLVQGITQINLAEKVAKGLDPDFAIAYGHALVEEGERVKATMKEQPVVSDKLVIANGQGAVEQAARAKAELDKLAGEG